MKDFFKNIWNFWTAYSFITLGLGVTVLGIILIVFGFHQENLKKNYIIVNDAEILSFNNYGKMTNGSDKNCNEVQESVKKGQKTLTKKIYYFTPKELKKEDAKYFNNNKTEFKNENNCPELSSKMTIYVNKNDFNDIISTSPTGLGYILAIIGGVIILITYIFIYFCYKSEGCRNIFGAFSLFDEIIN